MRKHLTEQVTLFASVVKWTLYASVVGALVGCGTAGFLRLLAIASRQATAYPDYFYLLPLTLMASSALVRCSPSG